MGRVLIQNMAFNVSVHITILAKSVKIHTIPVRIVIQTQHVLRRTVFVCRVMLEMVVFVKPRHNVIQTRARTVARVMIVTLVLFVTALEVLLDTSAKR